MIASALHGWDGAVKRMTMIWTPSRSVVKVSPSVSESAAFMATSWHFCRRPWAHFWLLTTGVLGNRAEAKDRAGCAALPSIFSDRSHTVGLVAPVLQQSTACGGRAPGMLRRTQDGAIHGPWQNVGFPSSLRGTGARGYAGPAASSWLVS